MVSKKLVLKETSISSIKEFILGSGMLKTLESPYRNGGIGGMCPQDFAINKEVSFLILDCVHTMPAHFENGEKCDGCKV